MKKQRIYDFLHQYYPLTGSLSNFVDEARDACEDVPEIQAYLSQDYHKKLKGTPTMQDLLVVKAATIYKILMPQNLHVLDTDDIAEFGRAFGEVPTCKDFRARMKAQLDAIGKKILEPDAETLETNIAYVKMLMKVDHTLPELLDVLDKLKEGKRVKEFQLKNIKAAFIAERDSLSESLVSRQIGMEEEPDKNFAALAGAERALALSSVLIPLLHSKPRPTPEQFMQQVEQQRASLKPDYLSDADFDSVVSLYRETLEPPPPGQTITDIIKTTYKTNKEIKRILTAAVPVDIEEKRELDKSDTADLKEKRVEKSDYHYAAEAIDTLAALVGCNISSTRHR
jgi:hypothetical protein